MRARQENSTVKTRVIAIIALAIALFLLQLLESHPSAVERFYSLGAYVWVSHILHPIFNILPFSFGDFVYMMVIGLIIYCLVRLVALAIKRQFKAAGTLLLGIIVGAQAAILAFYLLWGLNYFRPSAAQRLNLADTGYTTSDLASLTAILIDSANATRARLSPTAMLESNTAMCNEAVAAVKALAATSRNYPAHSPAIKLSLFTPLLNYIGTSGYFDPFTGEAQMNSQMPVFLRPFVACHEMSHQMGYGPEDEANFVGFLAAARAPGKLMRYSAYYEAVGEFMRDLRSRDTVLFKKMKLKVSPAVHNDFKAERDYWMAYESKIDVISSLFYDKFLKANNQPQGMQTYNQMVRLVISWYYKRQGQLPVKVTYR